MTPFKAMTSRTVPLSDGLLAEDFILKYFSLRSTLKYFLLSPLLLETYKTMLSLIVRTFLCNMVEVFYFTARLVMSSIKYNN